MNKLIKVILFLIVGMVQAFAWGGLRGDTLAKELDEAVLNRSFYLQQREQRITQLKDMFLLSKISPEIIFPASVFSCLRRKCASIFKRSTERLNGCVI